MILLLVHIQPNSSRNQVTSFTDGILKVKIAAPPVEGKANRKLVEFLSDVLDIARGDIKIKSGLTGKHKTLAIFNVSPEELKERFEKLTNAC